MGKSKEIRSMGPRSRQNRWHHEAGQLCRYIEATSQDIRKTIGDLHKFGTSLGAISKRLKVPRSSVKTIVCKYTPWDHSVLSPRDERTLVQKVQINPRTAGKDLVKMLDVTGTKVSISTVKTNPILT